MSASLRVGLAALALAACGRSPEALEAARVLRAIDVLRDAPGGSAEARLALIDALEREPAQGPLAARARDSCVVAYRRLEEASALEARVRSELAAAPGRGAVLAPLLVEAESKLHDGAANMPVCEEAQSALRRAFP